MLIMKMLGLADIVAGVVIFFNFASQLSLLLFFVLLIKGVMSLAADTVARIYGIVDITAGFVILFNTDTGPVVSLAFLVFYLYKGIMSMV